MIRQFYNGPEKGEHAEIQKWRKENLEGYLLNVISKKAGIIHCSICLHLGNTDWQASELGDLGKRIKVCSLNLNAIHQWARQNNLTHLTECADCKPFDDLRIMAEIAKKEFKVDQFNPDTIVDGRSRKLHDIVLRQGQPAFRKALLDVYGACCVMTGCNVVHVLEAAHIYPYQGDETNNVTNGLLLRADIHSLFDLKLITVHPETRQIHIIPSLFASEYGELNMKPLREPVDPAFKPSTMALQKHFEASGID